MKTKKEKCPICEQEVDELCALLSFDEFGRASGLCCCIECMLSNKVQFKMTKRQIEKHWMSKC